MQTDLFAAFLGLHDQLLVSAKCGRFNFATLRGPPERCKEGWAPKALEVIYIEDTTAHAARPTPKSRIYHSLAGHFSGNIILLSYNTSDSHILQCSKTTVKCYTRGGNTKARRFKVFRLTAATHGQGYLWRILYEANPRNPSGMTMLPTLPTYLPTYTRTPR